MITKEMIEVGARASHKSDMEYWNMSHPHFDGEYEEEKEHYRAIAKAALEAAEAVRPTPEKQFTTSNDYDGLLSQFKSMNNLISCMERELSYFRKKDFTLSEENLKDLEGKLESEKEMNHQLTCELEAVRSKTAECRVYKNPYSYPLPQPPKYEVDNG